jgi:hypothetical protein
MTSSITAFQITVLTNSLLSLYITVGVMTRLRAGQAESVLLLPAGSTCFGWYFHPSSGAYTTLSTASGICHTVTAICRYRGRVGTGLSVLWVSM